METKHIHPEDEFDYISWQKSQRRGKITAGILIVIFGIIYLINETAYSIPKWFFSLPVLLIGLGVVILVKHKFKKISGWVLVAIGKILLFNEMFPNTVNTNLIWPSIIILIGLSIIFKKKNHYPPCENKFQKIKRLKHMHRDYQFDGELSENDYIDVVSFFGGVNKNVMSKNFKGADVVTIFGGTELNLIQAEFEKQAVLDVTCVFGGVSLIIPSNWQVKSELVTVFGGIDDKRIMNPTSEDNSNNKILVLRGNCVFGGIDIKSFN